MTNRTHRGLAPIRILNLLLSAALIVGLAVPVCLKVVPRVRRSMAYHDVWCTAITDRPDDLLAALQAGGDPNARNPANEPALMVACHNGNTECARLLLQFGANPNLQGSGESTPLIHAVRNHQTTIIKMLLRKGANPDLADDKGDTALTMAAWVGAPDVRILLDSGANVNARNKKGGTPLSIAIHEGYSGIANTILLAGGRR